MTKHTKQLDSNSIAHLSMANTSRSNVAAIDNETIAYVKQVLQKKRNSQREEHTALPARFYTDPHILALEQSCIFNRQWICIGREQEIPNVGDFITTQVGQESLIMVRNEKDKINVLANVCRHRCMRVAEGKGKAAQGFSCPYHAWRYNLQGALVAAPLMLDKRQSNASSSSFKIENYSLASICSTIWQGFVYVNIDGKAPPLEQQLGGLDDILKNYHTDEMQHNFVVEEEWQCNWKALIENFIEAYHLNTVHPQTLKSITPTLGAKKLPSDPGYTAYAANYSNAYSASNQFSHTDLTPEEANRSTLFCVFPSHLATQSPHLLVSLAVQPMGVDRLKVRFSMSIRSEKMQGKVFDDLLELWQQINLEDRIKLEKMQQNYYSQFAQEGRLAGENLEGTIRDFHYYLANQLADLA